MPNRAAVSCRWQQALSQGLCGAESMRFFIIVLLFVLSACSSLDSAGSFHKRIGIQRASQLAGEYIVDNGLNWGDPISTRIVEDYVVFYYMPPYNQDTVSGEREGKRALHVDIHTGEVTEHSPL